MVLVTRQNRKLAFVGIVPVLFILLVSCCMTFPGRNSAFERRIDEFVKTQQPGSELMLFDGETLAGWKAYGLGKWRVKGGVVSVSGGVGYIYTRCDDFSDLILTLEARINRGGNSGIFFRSESQGFSIRPCAWLWAQIDNHDPESDRSLYNGCRPAGAGAG